jgi:hypothetical protein
MTEAEQNRKRPAPNATTLDEDALLDAAIADVGRERAMLDEAAHAEASNKERFLQRALEAAGTTWMNGGSILTDHGRSAATVHEDGPGSPGKRRATARKNSDVYAPRLGQVASSMASTVEPPLPKRQRQTSLADLFQK